MENNYQEYLEKLSNDLITEEKQRIENEKQLRKYAHPVKGGYMMTAQDLLNYFSNNK
jgi:hypothetical protein